MLSSSWWMVQHLAQCTMLLEPSKMSPRRPSLSRKHWLVTELWSASESYFKEPSLVSIQSSYIAFLLSGIGAGLSLSCLFWQQWDWLVCAQCIDVIRSFSRNTYTYSGWYQCCRRICLRHHGWDFTLVYNHVFYVTCVSQLLCCIIRKLDNTSNLHSTNLMVTGSALTYLCGCNISNRFINFSSDCVQNMVRPQKGWNIDPK